MKLNLKAIARSMGMALQKHSPEILTGIRTILLMSSLRGS